METFVVFADVGLVVCLFDSKRLGASGDAVLFEEPLLDDLGDRGDIGDPLPRGDGDNGG